LLINDIAIIVHVYGAIGLDVYNCSHGVI